MSLFSWCWVTCLLISVLWCFAVIQWVRRYYDVKWWYICWYIHFLECMFYYFFHWPSPCFSPLLLRTLVLERRKLQMRLPRKMAASFINMDASWPLTLDSEFQNLTCILTAIRIRKSNCPMKKQLPTWTNLNPHIKTLTAPGTLRPERRGLRPKPNGRYDPMETKKWELQVAIGVGSKNGIDESTGWFFNDANSSDFCLRMGQRSLSQCIPERCWSVATVVSQLLWEKRTDWETTA